MNDDKKIGYHLERTMRVTKQRFIRVFADLSIDITPDQWVILDALFVNGPMKQKQLIESSFKDAPTISRITDKLIEKKLVNKINGKDDKRTINLHITEKGEEIVSKCLPQVNTLRKKSWEGLSEKDYDEFMRIINIVFQNMQE